MGELRLLQASTSHKHKMQNKLMVHLQLIVSQLSAANFHKNIQIFHLGFLCSYRSFPVRQIILKWFPDFKTKKMENVFANNMPLCIYQKFLWDWLSSFLHENVSNTLQKIGLDNKNSWRTNKHKAIGHLLVAFKVAKSEQTSSNGQSRALCLNWQLIIQEELRSSCRAILRSVLIYIS